MHSNCHGVSRLLHSFHGCRNRICNCSSWKLSWVSIFRDNLCSGSMIFSGIIWIIGMTTVAAVSAQLPNNVAKNWEVVVFVCSAAVNRIINLTESTIASGDDAGCIKVSFLVFMYVCILVCFLDSLLPLHPENFSCRNVKVKSKLHLLVYYNDRPSNFFFHERIFWLKVGWDVLS